MDEKPQSKTGGSDWLGVIALGSPIVAAFLVDDAGSLFAGWLIGLLTGAIAAWGQKPDGETGRTGGEAGLPTTSVSGSAWSQKSSDKPERRKLPASLWESDMWPPPSDAIDHGGGLSFTYADANGEITERRIINWKEDPEFDHCFTGWCTDREEPRTFRIDRVQSWG